MSCIVLDGKALAAELSISLADSIAALKASNGNRTPILATILVGDDPSSATYVKMKGNACRRIGMDSRAISLPATITTEKLLAQIDALNLDADVHGILLQHPVPKHINERACFDSIDIHKDVDGVTSLGFGLMALGEPSYGSATPAGIMRLLAHYGIDVAGKRAIVVGRSPILGKPMSLMLSNANATVTLCHSRTENLAKEVSRADIVVGAVGKPEFIRSRWVKDGAVVIDAGYHIGGVGDIELDGLEPRCKAITPVPGGVGPMTIATLMAQTLDAAYRAAARSGA